MFVFVDRTTSVCQSVIVSTGGLRALQTHTGKTERTLTVWFVNVHLITLILNTSWHEKTHVSPFMVLNAVFYLGLAYQCINRHAHWLV